MVDLPWDIISSIPQNDEIWSMATARGNFLRLWLGLVILAWIGDCFSAGGQWFHYHLAVLDSTRGWPKSKQKSHPTGRFARVPRLHHLTGPFHGADASSSDLRHDPPLHRPPAAVAPSHSVLSPTGATRESGRRNDVATVEFALASDPTRQAQVCLGSGRGRPLGSVPRCAPQRCAGVFHCSHQDMFKRKLSNCLQSLVTLPFGILNPWLIGSLAPWELTRSVAKSLIFQVPQTNSSRPWNWL